MDRIAVVVATLLYLAAALTLVVWTWLPRAKASTGWISITVAILGFMLIVRIEPDQEWIWAGVGVTICGSR